MYDFDKEINRKNTACIKHDGYKDFGKNPDMIPLWVADMDFKTAPQINDALKKRCEHGIYGYSMADDEYYKAVQQWYKNRHNYFVPKEYIINSPGVVFALNCAVRAFTQPNDAIIIQRPVYYPFGTAITENNRKIINNPLVYKNHAYTIDFDDFEQKIIDNTVKMFILCNPHNPVGRVWTKEELTRLGNICLKHNVIVIADEIHSDFIHKGKHIVFASLKPEFEDISVTCTSPSKSFNLAGLQISNIFIANNALRDAFRAQIRIAGYEEPNVFALTAVKAAYNESQDWFAELLAYIQQNIERTKTYLAMHLPKVHMVEPEGTYLLWLDFSEYGFTENETEDIIQNKAKLWLDNGTMFGIEGKNFQRVNIASPWSIIQKALDNLKEALHTI